MIGDLWDCGELSRAGEAHERPKHRRREVKAVLILIAILAGFILARLGLPASFLTGPLLVAAIFAVTNRPVVRFRWSRTSPLRVLGSEDGLVAPPNDQLLRMALTGRVISGKASTVKTSSPLVSKLN